MIGYVCKSLRIISLVWPTRLVFLAIGEVLGFGFNLAVSFLLAFWERGSPDLPACGLRHGSNGGPARPILINTRHKTLVRGQALRGGRHSASPGAASSGWLTRRRRDQGGVPREVPMTQAMTTKGARRARAHA